MKQDERKVYVLSGTLVPYADGSGVSVTDSDNSIIVRDADTGGLEQVSPDAILSIDDVQDPYEQKELVAQSIREQFAREAADRLMVLSHSIRAKPIPLPVKAVRKYRSQ